MPSQQLQWVVVPTGIRKEGSRTIASASIAIQPRLEDASPAWKKLAAWPDMLDWPTLLGKATVGIEVNATAIAAANVTRVSTPSSDAWKALFDGNTPVKPYEMRNLTTHRVFSFPVLGVSEALSKVLDVMAKEYADGLPKMDAIEAPAVTSNLKAVGAANVKLPKVFEELTDLIPNEGDDGRMKTLERTFEEQATLVAKMRERPEQEPTKGIEQGPLPLAVQSPEQMVFTPLAGTSPKHALMQAEVFHMARQTSLPTTGPDGKKLYRAKRAAITRPSVDFHQALGACREYPAVMRAIGIVLDVEFDLPNGTPVNGTIRATVSLPAGLAVSTKVVTPRTAYEMATGVNPAYWRFLPRPGADSDIKNGLLCMDNPGLFGITQIDVDSTALKTMNYLRGLRLWLGKTVGKKLERRDAEPPSVRGTGLSLVRHQRGLRFATNILRNTKNHNAAVQNQEVILYADDVMRGFRLDVWDNVSNTWRSLMQRTATYTLLKNPDASIANAEEEGTMSMGATRPIDAAAAPINDIYAHEIIAQWEGWSLVVPRIGRYIDTDDTLSADTPGSKNSSSPDNAFEYKMETLFSVPKGSLPRLRYGRTYRLRARIADITGRGLTLDNVDPSSTACTTSGVLYQRWDPIVSPTIALIAKPVEGESLERLVIRTYNDGDVGSEPACTETSTRQLFPPVAAVEVAERHGKLDSSPTGPMRADLYATLATKTAMGSSDIPFQWYKRVVTMQNGPGGTQQRVVTLQELGAPNVEPASEADRATGIRYPLAPVSTPMVTPYLPDPMARGIVLAGVPGIAAGQLKEITLSGENAAAIASSQGVVTVTFDPDNTWPDIRSILLRLAEGSGAPTWDAASRTLSVFLPKGEQAWVTLGSTVGDTSADAMQAMALHGLWGRYTSAGHGAAKLQALARGLGWLVTPGRTVHLLHATQRPLTAPANKNMPKPKRAFGGTWADLEFPLIELHGRTTQKIDMLAEWKMDVDDILEPAPVRQDQNVLAFEQQVEDRLASSIDETLRQEFGDTKHRMVTYKPLATTRFREYMPSAIALDTNKLTRLGTGPEVNVLSTKRPDPPKVLYCVPSFSWPDETKTMVDGEVRSVRKGGGIRVYLDRPWYSSGNGELLGVVLYTGKTFTPKAKADDVKSESAKPSNTKAKGNVANAVGTSGMQIGSGLVASLADAQDGLVVAKNVGANAFGSANIADLLGGGTVNIPDNLTAYVTQWGLDPIWLSKPTPSDNSPRVANFIDPDAVHLSVSLEELGPKLRFAVVGFAPQFDADRKLWFCDVAISPGESYYPFIRMALVRFQPNSLSDPKTGNDVFVSTVVQSDFCQIAPDREAIVKVEQDATNVSITVIGHTYRMNSAGHAGSEVEVTIEERTGGASSTSDLAWTPLLTQRIDRVHAANAWMGMVKLAKPASANMRVVVKEYEVMHSDPTGKARETSLGSKTSNTGDVTLTVDKRIVYADVLPLG